MIAIAAFLPNRRRRAMLLSALVLTLLGGAPFDRRGFRPTDLLFTRGSRAGARRRGKGRRHQGSARYPG